MTQDELNKYLNDIAIKATVDNTAQFAEYISKTIDFTASNEEIVAQSILASALLATRLSSEIAIKILNQLNVISLDEVEYKEFNPEFKVILGGLGKDPKS